MHVIMKDLTAEAARRFPQAVTYARSLDADRASLVPIKRYLMQKERIDADHAERAVTEYLKYLTLSRATNEQLAPSEEADMAWHAHILHTELYAPFCRRHFGRFIHHVPSDSQTHPPESFLRKQYELGRLFFGNRTIYRAQHGHCSNSHACLGHACSGHGCTAGPSCSIN